MSSLIEKAALRLEQLRQAGVDAWPDASSVASSDTASDALDATDGPGAPAQPHARTQDRTPHAPPTVAPSVTPLVPRTPPRARAATGAPPRRHPVAGEADAVSRQVELDLPGLLARGYVTPNASRTELAAQFRIIKRPLIANATGRGTAPVANGNRIMVTSAMPGEGKSFTALNLAMSIAMELDFHVLLVDADVAPPSLMQVLGLPPGPGLLDLLTRPGMAMPDAMLRTNVDKLSLLPSGSAHPRATELLASDAMERLLDDMGQRYPDRLIIFDSPLLLATTESRVLASLMGQVVVVVQAGKTLHAELDQALATIEACPVKLLVLNQARRAEHAMHAPDPTGSPRAGARA